MSYQQLIDDYRKSVSAKNRARFAITSLILTTVLVFTFIAWKSLQGFLVSAVPEVSNLVAARVSGNSDLYLSYINRSANKVYPAYSSQMQKILKKEWPTIEKAGQSELVALNQYAQKRWPDFEKELANVATSQESTIQHELDKVLGNGNGEKIAESYSQAALNSYKEFERVNFSQHSKVGSSIGANLYQVIEREPDVTADADIHLAFGLALEVLGMELQELGKK